jgi:hypothetical protein
MIRDKHESTQGRPAQGQKRARKPKRQTQEIHYERNLILNQKHNSLDEELLNTASLSSTWNGAGSAAWDQARDHSLRLKNDSINIVYKNEKGRNDNRSTGRNNKSTSYDRTSNENELTSQSMISF